MYQQSGAGAEHHYPDSPFQVDWGYETGTVLKDPTCTDVGNFYGRIAAWYMQGGFDDEYGYHHSSPHHYPIRMWEVLNEMEHSTNIQNYICIYDAVVTAVREMADREQLIQFVGLAEEDASRFADYETFLNLSNHRNHQIPLDWISYHRFTTTDTTTYAAIHNISIHIDADADAACLCCLMLIDIHFHHLEVMLQPLNRSLIPLKDSLEQSLR